MKHQHTGRCRTLCIRCLLFTAGFPVEHYIWERAPLFRTVTHALGL
jgi:hypothetical protein